MSIEIPFDKEVAKQPDFEVVGKTTVSELFGRKLAPRADFNLDFGDAIMYTEISEKQMVVFKAVENDSITFYVCGPRIYGRDVNRLLHFAAPSKTFGIDVMDTINDWTNLYTKPENAKRLEAHRRIPFWSRFEESRQIILDIIKAGQANYVDKKPQSPEDYLVPVIVLKFKDGRLELSLDNPSDEAMESMATNGLYFPERSRMLVIIGALFLAAYSPDVTTKWPKQRTYSGGPGITTQDMGPTQTLPLVLANRSDLNFGQFLKQLALYCSTGEIPPELPDSFFEIGGLVKPKDTKDLDGSIIAKLSKSSEKKFLKDIYKNADKQKDLNDILKFKATNEEKLNFKKDNEPGVPPFLKWPLD